MAKLEPVRLSELDQKRAKRDSNGYAEMMTILNSGSAKAQDALEVGYDELKVLKSRPDIRKIFKTVFGNNTFTWKI